MDINLYLPQEHFKQLKIALNKQIRLDTPQVIRGEAGAIAKTMASRTRNAKPANVREKVFRKVWAGVDNISIGSGRIKADARGNVWYHPSGVRVRFKGARGKEANLGKKAFYFMGKIKYPSTAKPKGGNYYKHLWGAFYTDYKDYMADYKSDVARAVGHIGLTKATWVKVLLDLGFSRGVIPSLPPKGGGITPKVFGLINKAQKLSGATMRGAGDTFNITIYNSSAIASRRDAALFKRTVIGRQKYLMQSLRRGFADSVVTVRKQYPWIDYV